MNNFCSQKNILLFFTCSTNQNIRAIMSAMRKIAAVVGSSGIGKSKLAVELCKALSGQVINADALQVE